MLERILYLCPHAAHTTELIRVRMLLILLSSCYSATWYQCNIEPATEPATEPTSV